VLVGFCEEIFKQIQESLCFPEENIYPVEDDFFDHFEAEEEIVFSSDDEVEEEIIFDYPDETKEVQDVVSNTNFTTTTWLCDSAASNHMKNTSEGMNDLEEHTKKIIVGNGKEIYSTHIGTFTGQISQEDGTTSTVKLKDTYLVPDLWVNLFSLTKALTKGSKLSNQGEFIKVTSEDYSIKFDRKFSCGRGHLLAVDMIPKAKTKPAADTMFENLVIKNTIWKDERMKKDSTVIKSNCYGISKFWPLLVDEGTDSYWKNFLKDKGYFKIFISPVMQDCKVSLQILEEKDFIVKEYDRVREKGNFNQLWITQSEVMKEEFGKQIAGRVVQVPAAPNIGVVKPQEVMKYIKCIKDFDFNTKPKVKGENGCYEDKKFKDEVTKYIKDFDLSTKPKVKGENGCYGDKKFQDGVTKLGKKTVLIENDLKKMEIFLKHKNKFLERIGQMELFLKHRGKFLGRVDSSLNG